MHKPLYPHLIIQRALVGNGFGNVYSGSVGNTTFTKTGQVRQKSNPPNPDTPGQVAVRVALDGISNIWKTLTQAQQDAWTAMAANYPYTNRIGKVLTYSGQQLFMKHNLNLAYAGQSTLSSPVAPVSLTPPLISAAQYAVGAGTFSATFTPDPVDSDVVMVFEATIPKSAGVNFTGRSDYRQIQVIVATTASPFDLYTAYNSKFSAATPTAGSVIFLRACTISLITGQKSAYTKVKTVVIA